MIFYGTKRRMAGYPLKRLIDVVVSLTLIITLAPLFLIAMTLTLLDGHHSPIFVQPRLGKGTRVFNMYKFRTMKASPKGAKPVHYKPGAPELTPIARFMRKFNLDELPQLFNILKGDMSLVGPRPHAVEFAKYYFSVVPQYYERYRVRPGLACFVEVSPLHFKTEGSEDIKARIASDLDYVNKVSPWIDLKILFMIVYCTLRPHAFYNPATATQKAMVPEIRLGTMRAKSAL
jgi:lipopolysaccharide/colanic/teichoic acid biosynthesis glycosyltransferase